MNIYYKMVMKQKILWFDLAICSLWMLAALGGRTMWFAIPMVWIVLLVILARVAFSFSFYRQEKRSWVMLALFVGATSLCFAAQQDVGIRKLTIMPFYILGVDFDRVAHRAIGFVLVTWIWLVPVVAYITTLCRGRLSNSSLSWQEAFGTILWKDDRAKTYSLLMLIAVGTLYIGAIMAARACLFACIVAPILSYVVLNKYYGLRNENVWLIVFALGIFFFAQTHAGLWRMGMLAICLVCIVYVCSSFYKQKRMLALTLLSSLYLGVMLPSLAIGNNQYTCFNVGRTAYYSLDTYDGIFYIEDKNTEKIGLRDRYGILVNPEYDGIVYHTVRHWFGELELRKNGYITLYNICNNTFRKGDDINHELQDSICGLVEKHLTKYGYQYEDRLEAKVTDCNTNNVISWVKAEKNGPVIYDYKNESYIPTDSVVLQSGEVFCDSLVQLKYCQRQATCYSYDVVKDGMPVCNILVKAAKEKMPKREEVIILADKISVLLK